MGLRLILALVFILVYFAIYCLIRIIDVKFSGLKKEDAGKFAIVIFVNNAQNCIEDVVKGHEKLMGKNVEKIFIDLDSTDETTKILKKMQLKDFNLQVIEIKVEE